MGQIQSANNPPEKQKREELIKRCYQLQEELRKAEEKAYQLQIDTLYCRSIMADPNLLPEHKRAMIGHHWMKREAEA